MLSVAGISTRTEAPWGEKPLFRFTSGPHSITEGTQAAAVSVEERCSLVYSQACIQVPLLERPGPPSRDGSSHSGLGPLMAITNQKNTPRHVPIDKFDPGTPPVEPPADCAKTMIIPNCVKETDEAN